MNQLSILLVNDDGPTSPLVPFLIEALEKSPLCKDLRVVLPAEEKSWTSMAMTRLQPVYVREHKIGGRVIQTATGTPADCASLGIHSLYQDLPDLVISGINMGTNSSAPFFFSSGTVGGALMGALSGIKSIALSVRLPREVYSLWKNSDYAALARLANHWQAHAELAVSISQTLYQCDIWQDCSLANVNFPWSKKEKCKLVFTAPEQVRYQALFSRSDNNSYYHSFAGFSPATENSQLPTDLQIEDSGDISVARIKLDLVQQLSEDTDQEKEKNLNDCFSIISRKTR